MQRTRFDWRRITALALATAAELRSRALPEPDQAAPVAEIIADPEQVAADHMLAAYRALETAQPTATNARLFSKLRLMINKLEHGGLAATPTPTPTPDQEPTDNWFGSWRNRGRRLRGALRRLGD